MNIPAALAITVALLVGNAYFVGSEFAVMGSRRSRIEPLADQGRRGAKTVLYALENLTLMLATCQLGVTVCSVGLGVVSEPAIAELLSFPMHVLGAPAALTHTIAFLIALLLVVFLHVVLGEMVPKNVTITNPETLALIFMPPLVVLSKVFYPVVASLNWLSNHAVRLLGIEPKSEVSAAFTADEVASIVEVSEAAGVLDADAELLSGALEFSEHAAHEVMIPLDRLEVVSAQLSVEDFEELSGRTGFSRFPVQDDQGHLIGYVHVKDVLDVPVSRRKEPIPRWKVRPFPKVGAHDEVEAALKKMQQARTHMAVVVGDDAVVGSTETDSAEKVSRSAEGTSRSLESVQSWSVECGCTQSGDRDRGESTQGAQQPEGRQLCAAIGVIFLEDIVEELVGEVRDAMQRA
ncbi:MAG: hemolysin family protein [Arcanobacterium sp.]|nr:hemolysin family protein [Arcanobacterium sp.]